MVACRVFIMGPWDSFDRIIVINLPCDKERLREFSGMANSLGFEFQVLLPSIAAGAVAGRIHPGYIGNWHSHYSIARLVRDRPVLVFEDDCQCRGFSAEEVNSEVERIAGDLDGLGDWDLFCLGYLVHHIPKRVGRYLRICPFEGVHAYILSPKGARKFIRVWECSEMGSKLDLPTDLYISREGWNCLASERLCLIQHDETSRTEGTAYPFNQGERYMSGYQAMLDGLKGE